MKEWLLSLYGINVREILLNVAKCIPNLHLLDLFVFQIEKMEERWCKHIILSE